MANNERDSLNKWVDRGGIVFAVGVVGFTIMSMAAEPRSSSEMQFYLSAKVISASFILGGMGTALSALKDLAYMPHTHPHTHDYAQALHTHNYADASHIHEAPGPKVPSPAEIAYQRRSVITKSYVEEGLRSKFVEDLTELGLEKRAITAIIKNTTNPGLSRFPLSVAGLRMFYDLNIPFYGTDLGRPPKRTRTGRISRQESHTRARIREALQSTQIEFNGETYPTTQAERQQMVANNYLEIL